MPPRPPTRTAFRYRYLRFYQDQLQPSLQSSGQWEALQQFAQFCLVGATGVLVDMSLFWLLCEKLNLDLQYGKPIAAEVALLNNFAWNERWTFAGASCDRASVLTRLKRFHLICGSGIAISVCIVFILVRSLHFHALVANAIAIGMVSFWNFTLAKSWSWRSAKTAA